MGAEENLNKLRNELQKEIKEECQVICIMSRIRKTLEQNEETLGAKYQLLKFYCHWTLHPKINDISSIKEVLEKIAEAHKDQKISGEELYFMNLLMLRKEMSSFFAEFDLEGNLTKDNDKWKSFRNLLLEILIDCPLEPRSGPVERFAFKRLETNSDDINWEIKFRDDPIVFKGGLTEFDYRMVLKERNQK